MAYMNQEKKAALAPQIKAVLKKYGIKGSIAVRNHSTLVVNIRSGRIDFANGRNLDRWAECAREWRGYADANTYWIEDNWTGEARDFLLELKEAMNRTPDSSVANHDNSDIMTDYFDVGWYIDINVGRWNKNYEVAA